jgi:hypothetical protein
MSQLTLAASMIVYPFDKKALAPPTETPKEISRVSASRVSASTVSASMESAPIESDVESKRLTELISPCVTSMFILQETGQAEIPIASQWLQKGSPPNKYYATRMLHHFQNVARYAQMLAMMPSKSEIDWIKNRLLALGALPHCYCFY